MPNPKDKSLKIQVERQGPNAVVRLSGFAGMMEDQQIRQCLGELAADKVAVVVLDLSDLEWIGSAGLGAIVYGHLKGRHHQGQIRLACPRPNVLEVLKRTCLNKLFEICPSVAEALHP